MNTIGDYYRLEYITNYRSLFYFPRFPSFSILSRGTPASNDQSIKVTDLVRNSPLRLINFN